MTSDSGCRTILVCLTVLVCFTLYQEVHSTGDHELSIFWRKFKERHRKRYENDDEETKRRFIWEKNLHVIQEHNLEENLGEHSFTLGLNEYSDLTNEEYRQLLTGFRKPKDHNLEDTSAFVTSTESSNLPTEVNWVQKGYVTPVKNQGRCGSCWAFSATGALEGQHFKKTAQLISFSEQNLVDCSLGQGNQGCNGGLPDYAFNYVRQNQGIASDRDYPYTGKVGQCQYQSSEKVASCTGWTDIPSGNEAALQEAVATIGPIAAAIDAGNLKFQFYRRGIYSNKRCSSTELDHAILITGYGESNGEPYWLVKNSWGTTWGDDGYVKIARNSNNMCGIATMPSYPTV